MPMPEAAMDEDYRSAPGEHQVGTSWQTANMKVIAISEPVDQSTHRPFWTGVFGSHASHLGRSLIFV